MAEVAELLKLNKQTVYNWISAGTLPAVKVGRRVRIHQRDVTRLTDPDGSRRLREAEWAREDGVVRMREEANRHRQADARRALTDSLTRAGEVDSDADLAAALRELARAADVLANALDE